MRGERGDDKEGQRAHTSHSAAQARRRVGSAMLFALVYTAGMVLRGPPSIRMCAPSYTVILEKPLGLILDEVTPDGSDGVEVGATQEDSNTEKSETFIGLGDRLLSVGGFDVTS